MRAPVTADVRSQLRAHLLGDYLFTDDPSALGDDDSFQETRIIDSMGMMQLIQFVESTFGIRLDEADLVPEKLDSVNRLVRLIEERTAASAPPPPPTLVHLLARSVAADPGREAIVSRSARLTRPYSWARESSAALK